MDKFTITFTMDEMRIIDEALGNLPYKKACGVINSINEQINTQFSKQETNKTEE